MVFFSSAKARAFTQQTNSAIERAAKIKEQKIIDAKLKNRLKEEEFNLRKSMIAQNDAK